MGGRGGGGGGGRHYHTSLAEIHVNDKHRKEAPYSLQFGVVYSTAEVGGLSEETRRL